MTRADGDEAPLFDFWPYFDAIPVDHFQAHDCSSGRVEYVYQHSSGVFEHVLVDSEDKNIFMVVVIHRSLRQVHGHYLLDINEEYGVNNGSA
jgi:hypothetical protein